MDLFHSQGIKVMSGMLADRMTSHSCDVMLILGVTRSGDVFRPSDWVDRLAGPFSTFCRDRRLKYLSSVRPVIIKDNRGLLVDISLLERDPVAFRFLLDFAVDNDLMIQCLGDASGEDFWPSGVLPVRDALSEISSGTSVP